MRTDLPVATSNGTVLIHTACVSMMLLCEVFGYRVISKDIWPPWSPELTLADSYLWGAMKGIVYKDSPRPLPELKEDIANFIGNVPLFEL
jgi:hypothetical protein